MNKILDFIKKHPYGTAAAVFGIGILWLLLRSSNSAPQSAQPASSVGTEAAATQSANQLAAIQAQASTQVAAIQGQVQDVTTNANAAQNIAQIQAAQSINNTTTAGDVASFIAGLTNATQQSSIAAQQDVANNNIAAQVQINKSNNDALVEVATAPYDVQQAEIQAQVTIAGLQAAAYAANAPTAAAVATINANLGILQNDINLLYTGTGPQAGGYEAINKWINDTFGDAQGQVNNATNSYGLPIQQIHTTAAT